MHDLRKHCLSRGLIANWGTLALTGCLAARLAAAQGVGALEINRAVQLQFTTQTQQVYQLMGTGALPMLTPAGPWVVGDGSTSQVFSTATNAAGFFRLATNPVRDLGTILEGIRSANNVPAVACAVVLSNQLVGLGVVGQRKWGVTNAPVTLTDAWHHGSITKGMTATLAAMLVEQGKIQWTTKLADVFADFAPSMNAQWKQVTLEELLSHRSGAPGDLTASGIWTQLWNFGGTARDVRRLLLHLVTVLSSDNPPGTAYEYSNAGVALAGAMLEEVMNQPWEDLLTARLFRPLGMTTAGFGVPATPRMINQPWGHVFQGTTPSPIEPGTSADNPTAIGPAATVHCSLIDLARYAEFHLAGEQGDTPLLTHASFVKLHQDVAGQGYALGWAVTTRPWSGGVALNHSGSNTQWYTNVWLAPGREFAVIALTNIGDANGGSVSFNTTDQIAGRMISEFLGN